MKRHATILLASLGLATACSSGGSSSSSDSSGTGSFTGTLGGEAFVLRSGVGHVDAKDGSLDLILSDAANLCDSIAAKKFHVGETLVQAYHLTGTAPGVFTSKPGNEDIKYASVRTTCTLGQAVESNIDKKGEATKAEFTISRLTATEVEGKVTATFDDGSSVTGTFTVPICAASEAEGATCL